MKKNKKIKNINILSLNLPHDLKKMSIDELKNICSQIRKVLVKSISKTGGHLASNLGTVELTVAMHKVFDCPNDKIVWDVGHQSYTHKILTGRLNEFDTLRQENGLSGFAKPSESKYDAFISGHSSNSISAALGIATAMKKSGDDHHAIAVIGDGAFTGGLAYEGLNNAGKSDTNIIIILNHNEMSISKNVGALAKYLTTIRTKQSYVKTKSVVGNVLDKTPIVGKPLKRVIKSSKSAIKDSIIHSTMFEDFGCEFVGPVDGHNIAELVGALNDAKAMKKPTLVHVNTIKGKGYTPAEINPGKFHSIGSFEIATGNPNKSATENFSSMWGKELSRLADNDDRICAVTAAMKYGTGLQYFTNKHKDRFYDVGIAEEHAVTFSAGLSKMGLLPVFSVYSTFLQRTYDELLHDVAIDNIHLVLGIDRAGIVGEDGETHQGVFDVSFLTSIPNMTLYSPSTYDEMKYSLNKALYEDTGICAVRYPKGQECLSDKENCELADFKYKNDNNDILIISYGRLINNIYDASDKLYDLGVKVDILKLVKIFPISDDIIDIVKKYKYVFIFEEVYKSGAIGEKIASYALSKGFKGNMKIKGIDEFVKQAKVQNAIHNVSLDSKSVCDYILKGISDENEA